MTMLPEQPGRDRDDPPVGVSSGSGPGCPDPEQLAAFVDGTLDDAARRRVEEHLADCDACLELVAETAAAVAATPATGAGRPAADVVVLPQRRPARRPALTSLLWVGGVAAAAAALVIALVPPARQMRTEGSVTDPVTPSDLRLLASIERTTPGRLAGFDHAPFRSPTRSGPTSPDSRLPVLEAARRTQLEATRAPLAAHRHAWGVAQILIREWDGAIATLDTLARERPDDPRVLNDLAVAFIGRGTTEAKAEDLARAIELADGALRRDPSSNEALFNRAVALEGLGRRAEAEAAYRSLLQRDHTSWRQEVEGRLAALSRTP